MVSLKTVTEQDVVQAGVAANVRSSLFWVVVVALALRLAVVGFLYPERLNPERDHWRFAGETGRIAQSIVEGRGFSSPFQGSTGPTAIMPPIYPSLLAGVFRLFGIYTKASALAMLSLDSLFSALTCIPVFLIAQKSFGGRTAVWAGWAWAFFPYAIYFSADFIWVTTLATLMLALLFLAALHLEDSARVSTWIGFGVLAGVGALVDPVVLSVIPLLVLWICYRRLQNKQRWFVPALVAALAFGVTVSPWMIRNYRVFHTFVPFRDNFGLELYVGNNGNTWHFAPDGFHPSSTEREMNEYAQIGELAYMRHKQAQAVALIKPHPGDFAVLSLRRALYMWTNFWSFGSRYLEAEPLDPPNIFLCTTLTVLALAGLRLAFQRDASTGMPYAIALFFFPMVYYVTHPQDYYRRPVDPIFVVLAAYAVTSWMQNRTRIAPSQLRAQSVIGSASDPTTLRQPTRSNE
jgi:4-amino-4-deoxy-L-arabinose transferase-like glycosyltransferase